MTPVVVQSLDQARAVLAGTKVDQPVSLISPPGAARLQGIGWWQALSRILGDEFPEHTVEAILDCGDSPGLALAALRAGVSPVRVVGVNRDMRDKLNDIARQLGTRLMA
ncbi:conserved protein of unknown function [Magnetospirillum sp. XM-1]|uniref:hypothetical protein n=1 Tax=Magnetospirillum sp. XM-1 TaxID=1663591 RepID=UPI00073DE215|nr:hypothetical protein [Magnetospirillum sp. XM-1]CUW41196.1 conserved protein of unknown function [Magnetospirillum sp. XM-1]